MSSNYAISPRTAVILSGGLIASSIVIGLAWSSASDQAEESCYAALAMTEKAKTGDYNLVYKPYAPFWKQAGCYLELSDP